MLASLRIVIAAMLLAAPLTACAIDDVTSIPTSPSSIAQRTVADEQAAIAVELGYKTFRLAVETAVDAKLVKGQLAVCLADVDNRAFAATQVVQRAYATANATDFASALAGANALIADGTGKLAKRSC